MAKTPTTATPVSCVDCEKHVARSAKAPGLNGATIHECRGVRDRITGVITTVSCAAAVSKYGQCGPSGRLFVAKQPMAAE